MNADDRAQAYATALLDAAADRWLQALATVDDRLSHNPVLLGQLTEVTTDLGQRQRLLDTVIPGEADPPLRNFLYALLQRGDLASLREVIDSLRQRISQLTQETVRVEVTSAVALTQQERERLQGRLEQQFGGNLDIHYRVDPAILGGMIVRAGDRLIDGSVASRLAAMRQAMGVTNNQ